MKLKQIGSNMTLVDLNNASILVSYETPVAAFIEGHGYLKTAKKWSKTTSRHINKWLEGINAEEKSQEFFDNLLQTKEVA